MDRSERHLAVVRRWIEEGRNQGRSALVDEVWAPDVVFHQVPDRHLVGREQYRAFYERAKLAGETVIRVDEALAADGWAVTRCSWSTVLQGVHHGVDRTGTTISSTALVLWHFDENDQVVEVWDFADNVSVLRQLELLPMRPSQEGTDE